MLVRRNKTVIIPDAYWNKVLETKPIAFGMALVENGTLQSFKVNDVVPDLKVIQEAQESFKDYSTAFSFIGSAGSPTEEDMSPYIILTKQLDGKDTPLLMAMLDGDFNAYAKSGSTHPPEFFLANGELREEISYIYNKIAGGNIDKLMGELDDPTVKKRLINMSVPHGTILLLANTGEFKVLDKDDKSKKFDGWWTSDTLGYTEATAEVMEEPKKVMTFKERYEATKAALASKKGAGDAVVTKPAEVTKVGATTVVHAQPDVTKDTSTSSALPKYKTVMMEPPKNIQHPEDLKKWYRQHTLDGKIPSGWKKRPEVEVSTSKLSKSLADLQTMVGVTADAITSKDTEPVLDRRILSALHDDFMKRPGVAKYADVSNQDILDPRTIHELERDHPALWQLLGLQGLESTLRWQWDDIEFLGTKYPKALAIHCMNIMTAYYKQLVAEGKQPSGVELADRDTQRKAM